MAQNECIVTIGERGPEFKAFIESILQKGKIKRKYITLLTDEESLDLYARAFTNPTADAFNNYEMLEKLGDGTCNNIINFYIYRKLGKKLFEKPQGVMIMTRLGHNMRNKKSFAEIGIRLGFEKFISHGMMSVKNGEMKSVMQVKRNSVVEDCFEAFFGATEILVDTKIEDGIGYAFVRDILFTILDESPFPSIRYEDLFDPVTRLKELFDYKKFNLPNGTIGGLGTYKIEEVGGSTTGSGNGGDALKKVNIIYKDYTNLRGPMVIAQGQGAIKATAEQNAAEIALTFFKARGFEKKAPYDYREFIG